MKKNIVVIAVILATIFSAINAVAIESGSSSYGLQVSFISNPTIVSPGVNGYLEVTCDNPGSTTITDIDIEPSNWDEAVIETKGNWNVDIGALSGGDSTTVLYEFYIPPEANPGLYQIIFTIESSTGETIRQTAMIKVEDTTLLDISSVTPQSINIGEETTLLFNITNNGGSSAGNILLTWENSNDYILPVGGDNRITIPSIEAQNYTLVPIEVVADPSVVAGVYPLAITLEYCDRTGTKQTITSKMGLQIGGGTNFEIVLQTTSGMTSTFAIANTGSNTASSVIVSIPTQPNYGTSGSSAVNLGNLDAGDYTLASFQLSSTLTRDTNASNTQRPGFNRDSSEMPSDLDPSMMQDFRNMTMGDMNGNNLIVEVSYTDLFGLRQTVEKEISISSQLMSSSTSGTSTFAGRGSMSSSGFPGQEQDSGLSSGTTYILIGVIGIILIVAILTIGKKKKIPYITKLLERNKE